MTNVVSELQSTAKAVSAVRSLSIPNYRRAYSDRTAWLMACLSELAYVRFNPMFSGMADRQFVERVEQVLSEKRVEKFRALIGGLAYDPDAEIENLRNGLEVLDCTLERTFDRDGTQAILVSCSEFVAVAFRGTEATSIKDIKADLNAVSREARTEGRVHTGFDEALMAVEGEIQQQLDSGAFDSKPLFITGHSLGGALAALAAKRLEHSGGVAACYTFGSPRVGDDVWVAGLKAPVYRLVNAADCVTMLPPGALAVATISWLTGRIPWVGAAIRQWLKRRFGGYMHGGDMRYLSNCRTGEYSQVQLLFSVSIFYRIKGLLLKSLPWKKFVADHSISIYREKLMILASRRNSTALKSQPS